MSVDNPKDRRLDNANHLKGLRLQFREYTSWSDTWGHDHWGHDHCFACNAKFAGFDGPEIQHSGYATGDDYKHATGHHGIRPECFPECFDDLKADMAG